MLPSVSLRPTSAEVRVFPSCSGPRKRRATVNRKRIVEEPFGQTIAVRTCRGKPTSLLPYILQFTVPVRTVCDKLTIHPYRTVLYSTSIVLIINHSSYCLKDATLYGTFCFSTTMASWTPSESRPSLNSRHAPFNANVIMTLLTINFIIEGGTIHFDDQGPKVRQ